MKFLSFSAHTAVNTCQVCRQLFGESIFNNHVAVKDVVKEFISLTTSKLCAVDIDGPVFYLQNCADFYCFILD